MNANWIVRQVKWDTHLAQLHAIRRIVFVEEQGVPESLEWDRYDERAQHLLAYEPDGIAVGTGRLLPDGRIGRMAVLRPWRRRGVGSALLVALLDLARKQKSPVARLHAQQRAVAFYAKHGFTVTSEEFMEAGIPHRAMELKLLP
jgi:predicted GNAT family N-acyltransferase